MAHPSFATRRSALVISLEGPRRSRRVVLGAGASLLVGTLLLVVGVWAIGAALYLSFRDEVLTSILARQAAMRYAYEDRIAGLRAQIDRVTSRQLIDQDSFEGKMQELASRQAQLETRQAIVGALMAQATNSLGLAANAPAKIAAAGAPPVAPLPPARPSSTPPMPPSTSTLPAGVSAFAPGREPFGDMPALRGSGATPPSAPAPSQAVLPPPSPAIPDRRVEAPVSLQKTSLFEQPLPGRKDPAIAGARLRHISLALEGVERGQEAALGAVEGAARAQSLRLKGIVAELGLDIGRLKGASRDFGNEGGPFVPVAIDAEDGPFGAAVDRLQKSLLEAERLRSTVSLLPLARPLPGDPEITSTFGTRVDPFTRGLALHTGLDLREEWGTPVRATGSGVVTSAEWSGGYGNLVEIDHGTGLTTRYGHLSAFLVGPGDRVQAGTVVGRVGSTGRSTGPHLHYETRIDGEPVDPQRFLRVARRLAAN